MLYRNLSGYFREKYGKRLKKICIDGGFTCPNRDGSCGVGGCIFCGDRGSGEHIDAAKSIGEQVKSALDRAKDGEEFVAYFQSFTNTYAPIKTLRERYDAALIDPRIKVLAIGTRPDCIDRGVAELIAEYAKRLDVWVELGLQTANDRTAELINRGYTRKCFDEAVRLLTEYGIPVVAHLIVGLPNEGMKEIEETAEYVASLPLFGIKIHSIYVMRGTALEEMYLRGEYEPPSLDMHVKGTALILSRISEDVVVHRLTGDCPPDLLVAPQWNSDKHSVINAITDYMQANRLYQGCKHSKSAEM